MTIVYAEDIPEGRSLMGYLDSKHVVSVISPLHDKDTFDVEDVEKWKERHCQGKSPEEVEELLKKAPKVGDFKKAHYHVLVDSSGPKTREDFSKLLSGLVDIRDTSWEKIGNWSAAVRYTCHLDTPEKERYSVWDVTAVGGADVSDLAKTDRLTNMEILVQVDQMIRKEGILYFPDLVDWARESHNYDYIACVRGGASYFQAQFNGWRTKRLDVKAAQEAEEEAERQELERIKAEQEASAEA